MNKTTAHWLDVYEMALDRGIEVAKDPKKAMLARGVSEKEIAEQEARAPLPGKMDMEEHRRLMSSWKRVRVSIQIFGLELGEDLEITPQCVFFPNSRPFYVWSQNAWLKVHRAKGDHIEFKGRDAKTALNFFSFYGVKSENVDPTKEIKAKLLEQGITKENFAERMAGTSIRNPWDEDTLTPA